MPLTKKIKLTRIGIKTYSGGNGTYLSGIQLEFTNGVSSPMFETNNAKEAKIKWLDIDST